MVIVGEDDAFERIYREKFRLFASKFGEFVNYERDRGARDIGLHLTHKLKSGKERLSSSLCWFQLKGIMKSTLPRSVFSGNSIVKVSLNVDHLRYWFLQPMPTYLVLYVECVDRFFILNIQNYISKKLGKRILKLKQKTHTVEVSTESVLDKQAFNLIIQEGDINEWRKALGADESEVKICMRDYDLIWHLGTASKRNVEHRVNFMDWQSKLRGQFYIQERLADSDTEWNTLREHLQFMMNIFDLQESYPYVEFYDLCSLDEDNCIYTDDDEDSEVPRWELSNGDVVLGKDVSGEFFEYNAGMRLNNIGVEMFGWVLNLLEIGLIEISPGKGHMLSIAPWHARQV